MIKPYVVIIFIISLLFLLLLFGFLFFQRSVDKDKEALFKEYFKSQDFITEDDLKKLPLKLQKYLKKVDVIGKRKSGRVTFKQRGKIKTAREKDWTSFKATQYMSASYPGFIWNARAYPLFIRDKSISGKGEVKVNLFGLKDVAKSKGLKTDESALARCLGEFMFYPVGFFSETISWKVLDENRIKATVQIHNLQSEGIFYFNDEGLLSRFESKRYMGQTLEDFTGIAEDYKTMDGLYVPTRMRAIWNLPDGDFEYFNCTLIEYNIE